VIAGICNLHGSQYGSSFGYCGLRYGLIVNFQSRQDTAMIITLNGNRVYLFRCSDIKSDNKSVNILVNMGKCYNKRFVRWSSNI
jgi:hypothetical protein